MNAVLESGKAVAGAVHAPRLQVFKWLVRRELWEHRGIWIAPAICAAIILFSAVVGHVSLDGNPEPNGPGLVVNASAAAQWAGTALLGMAVPFYITLLFTQIFYALNSLFDDRKDRSVLFWKSLPASDLETVLSKVFVASVVLPLVALLFTVATQAVFAAHAFVGALASPRLWLADILTLLWVAVGFALWTLPLVGYGLLVSAATARAPFVVAGLLVGGVGLAESLLFHGDWFVGQLFQHAFGAIVGLSHATAGPAAMNAHGYVPSVSGERLLAAVTSPDLWGGVVLGVLFIGGAVWARRYRDENT